MSNYNELLLQINSVDEINNDIDETSYNYSESVDIVRLYVHESFQEGIITEEERDELLGYLSEGFLVTIKNKFANNKNKSIPNSQQDTNSNTGLNVKSEINKLNNVRSETKNDMKTIEDARKKLLEAKAKMNVKNSVQNNPHGNVKFAQ